MKLFFLRPRAGRDVKDDLSVLKYIEIIPPSNEVGQTLGCISVRWFTAAENDYYVTKRPKQKT